MDDMSSLAETKDKEGVLCVPTTQREGMKETQRTLKLLCTTKAFYFTLLQNPYCISSQNKYT